MYALPHLSFHHNSGGEGAYRGTSLAGHIDLILGLDSRGIFQNFLLDVYSEADLVDNGMAVVQPGSGSAKGMSSRRHSSEDGRMEDRRVCGHDMKSFRLLASSYPGSACRRTVMKITPNSMTSTHMSLVRREPSASVSLSHKNVYEAYILGITGNDQAWYRFSLCHMKCALQI